VLRSSWEAGVCGLIAYCIESCRYAFFVRSLKWVILELFVVPFIDKAYSRDIISSEVETMIFATTTMKFMMLMIPKLS
jgi:hypothetical protein